MNTPQEPTVLDRLNGEVRVTALKGSLSEIITRVFERKPVQCRFTDRNGEGVITMKGNGVCMELTINDYYGEGGES